MMEMAVVLFFVLLKKKGILRKGEKERVVLMSIPMTISRDDLYLVTDAKNNYHLYGLPFHRVKKDISQEEKAWIEDFVENDVDNRKLLRETSRFVRGSTARTDVRNGSRFS